MLAAVTLIAVRSGVVSLSFNRGRYEGILGHFSTAVTRLEKLAKDEAAKAERLLAAHRVSNEIATKASITATNIGKLIG